MKWRGRKKTYDPLTDIRHYHARRQEYVVCNYKGLHSRLFVCRMGLSSRALGVLWIVNHTVTPCCKF